MHEPLGLQATLTTVAVHIRSGILKNEADLKQFVVLPILRALALEWDDSDPQMTRRLADNPTLRRSFRGPGATALRVRPPARPWWARLSAKPQAAPRPAARACVIETTPERLRSSA